MDPRSLGSNFKQYLAEQDLDPSTALPMNGLRAMVRFYAERRAIGCDAYSGEDMLLFQWGTYDWGSGEHFEVNLTRQVMLPGEIDDEAIWQLGLTYYWPPIPELRALGNGDRWCESLDELAAFEVLLRDSAALSAIAGRRPNKHELAFECAG